MRHHAPGGHGRRQRRGRRRGRATGRSTSARVAASAPACRTAPPVANAESAHFAWYAPSGLLTPAPWVAMFAQRYLHVTGATSEDFGRVAVADRALRGDQPEGVVLRASRSPWRTTRRRAGSSSRCACSTAARSPTAARPSSSRASSAPATCPARRRVIEAAAQGSGAQQDMMTSYYRDDMTRSARDGGRGPPAVGDDGPRARRHPVRRPLRPLHAVRAATSSRSSASAAGRGQGLPPRRRTSRSGGSCPSTPTAASSARPTSTG